MAYSKTTWVDGSEPAITAAQLNRVEQGIADAHAGAIDAKAIGTGVLADAAVTEAKIAAGAVSNAKLANGAVTAGKLGANAVTEAKIASGAVTSDKLASAAVTSVKLATGNNERDWVYARIGNIGAINRVGAYSFMHQRTAVDTVKQGDTRAGTSLYYADAKDNDSGYTGAGTWVCMGYSGGTVATLWLRIL